MKVVIAQNTKQVSNVVLDYTNSHFWRYKILFCTIKLFMLVTIAFTMILYSDLANLIYKVHIVSEKDFK